MKGTGALMFALLAFVFVMYGGEHGPSIREGIVYQLTGEKVWLVRMEG